MKLRYLTGAMVMLAGASLADPLPAPDLTLTVQETAGADSACTQDDLSVLTYNVAGLPWPLAKKGAGVGTGRYSVKSMGLTFILLKKSVACALFLIKR